MSTTNKQAAFVQMRAEHGDLYPQLNRMQRRIMARESWVSRKAFEAESREEQVAYYKWMVRQCGEMADLL